MFINIYMKHKTCLHMNKYRTYITLYSSTQLLTSITFYISHPQHKQIFSFIINF